MPTTIKTSPLVRIVNSLFHRRNNPKTFFPRLDFALPAVSTNKTEHWAILGPSASGKSTFLQILQGKHKCSPYGGRTFPLLTEQKKFPQTSIGYVEFSGTGGLGERVRGEYMSSRYESRRDPTAITLRKWLLYTAEDLPLWTDNYDFEHHKATERSQVSLELVSKGLKLEKILDQAVSTLSNGQGRRARIAQALLRGVDLLLLDEPFMGLDPSSTSLLSHLLQSISSPATTDEASLKSQVVIALRPQDKIPKWITHLVYVNRQQVLSMGERKLVQEKLSRKKIKIGQEQEHGLLEKAYNSISTPITHSPTKSPKDDKEILVEMNDVQIAYWGKEILKDFSWTVRRGDRWGLFGPNGSGKTTVLSLLTSDHPLSYSLPIKIFGRSRLPEPGVPGISIFDIQARIGHSSPEIHQFFPKYRTLRQCIESAYADTFISKPALTPAVTSTIDAMFEHFRIPPSKQMLEFCDHSLAIQRLALFMRAVVKKPDLVVLDEAFSGMDERLRDKCIDYLQNGGGLSDEQALVVVSHIEDEVPEVVDRYLILREAGIGGGAVFGER